MPSATSRAPGSIPAIFGRPWKTSSRPPVPSLSTHSRFEVPARGWTRTDLTRPATRTRWRHSTEAMGVVAPARWAERLVGGQHRSRPPRPLAPAHAVDPARPSVPTVPSRRRPDRRAAPAAPSGRRSARARRIGRRRLKGTMVALTWGTWRQHGGDLVGRAVVQEALPDPWRSRAGAAARCTRCRRRAIASATSSMAGPAQPPVRALDDVEGQAGQPEPAPVRLELAGASVSMSKCTARRSSGCECAGVLDGPGGRQVEAVDQHDHHVAAQHRGLPPPPPRPSSSMLAPPPRTGGAGGSGRSTPSGRTTTMTQAPSVNLATAKMSTTTNERKHRGEAVDGQDAAPPVALPVGQVVLDHARPGHGEAGEHADGVEGDQAVDLGLVTRSRTMRRR